jgi:hypothetical protein
MKSTIIDNAQRAARLEEAMLAFREEYGDDPFTIIVDLLADAMHWCDANSETFAYALAVAGTHYVAELNGEQTHERRMP